MFKAVLEKRGEAAALEVGLNAGKEMGRKEGEIKGLKEGYNIGKKEGEKEAKTSHHLRWLSFVLIVLAILIAIFWPDFRTGWWTIIALLLFIPSLFWRRVKGRGLVVISLVLFLLVMTFLKMMTAGSTTIELAYFQEDIAWWQGVCEQSIQAPESRLRSSPPVSSSVSQVTPSKGHSAELIKLRASLASIREELSTKEKQNWELRGSAASTEPQFFEIVVDYLCKYHQDGEVITNFPDWIGGNKWGELYTRCQVSLFQEGEKKGLRLKDSNGKWWHRLIGGTWIEE